MGLLVWRAPDSDALKVDPTAPARSPIRRRPPVASRRARPARSLRSPRLLDTDVLLSAAGSSSASRVAPAGVTRVPPPVDLRVAPPPVPEPRHYARSGDSAHDTSALQRRGSNSTRPDRRELPSFTELTALHSSRPPAALTPNFAPAVAARESRTPSVEQRQQPNSRDGSSNFRVSVSPGRNVFWTSSVHAPRGDNHTTVQDGEDSTDNNAVGPPPLRRMGRRQIADGPLPSSSLRESWSPATTLDGLGDRERSISPVDDHWDNLLSTVAPDPLPPTAHSSFASAAASASFSASHPSSRAGSSNSTSASSSHTHLTVPSRHDSPPNDLFMLACESSESDTASDTEDEDDMQAELYVPYLTGQRRADGPPSQSPHRYSHGVRDRSRNASAYVRDLFFDRSDLVRNLFERGDVSEQRERPFGQLDGPAEETTFGDDDIQTLDQELRDARAILERLARREDISDEHWASIGLTRFLADRVERIQQRERL